MYYDCIATCVATLLTSVYCTYYVAVGPCDLQLPSLFFSSLFFCSQTKCLSAFWLVNVNIYVLCVFPEFGCICKDVISSLSLVNSFVIQTVVECIIFLWSVENLAVVVLEENPLFYNASKWTYIYEVVVIKTMDHLKYWILYWPEICMWLYYIKLIEQIKHWVHKKHILVKNLPTFRTNKIVV